MVNGKAYTGWLTDTDGHRYYFNKKGIMQTGTITIDGQKYTFASDGSLKE